MKALTKFVALSVTMRVVFLWIWNSLSILSIASAILLYVCLPIILLQASPLECRSNVWGSIQCTVKPIYDLQEQK